MKRLMGLWRDQRGQSLPIHAFSVLIMVVILGGLLEIGWWSGHYYQARQGVDLAALSAAHYIPLSPEERNQMFDGKYSINKATDTAQEVFKQNYEIRDFPKTNIANKGSTISGWNEITVTHQELLPTLFLENFISDLSTYNLINVQAKGRAEALYQPTYVAPIGLIKKTNYELPYDLENFSVKGDLSNPVLPTGNNITLGILNPVKNGTMSDSNATDWLANDYKANGIKAANETADWNKTLSAQSAADALNTRVASGNKKMIIPVVSTTTNGKGEVTILGFACFEITSAKVTGTGELSITGKFLKHIDTKSDRKPSSIPSSTNAKYFGVRIVYLTD